MTIHVETELKARLDKFDKTIDKYNPYESPKSNLALAHLVQAQATVIAALIEKLK